MNKTNPTRKPFFTDSEILWLSGSPEALRIAAIYRDFQQGHSDAMGAETTGDETRRLELLAEAKRIEDSI